MKFVIASCQAFVRGGMPQAQDDIKLFEECKRRGIETDVAGWDDPHYAWAGADVVVVRSSWNYFLQPERYLRWLQSAIRNATVINPLQAILWNFSKSRYFADLSTAGFSIIPTKILRRGGDIDLRHLLEVQGWPVAVIKPDVGANSFGVRTVDAGSTTSVLAAQEHFHRFGRDMLVQPFLAGEEHSHVFLNGQYAHTFLRTPFRAVMPGSPLPEQAVRPLDDEVALATRIKRVAERKAGRLVFGRVDLVRDEDGQLKLMELELHEPNLALGCNERALPTMIAGIEAAVRERTAAQGVPA